MGPFPHHAPKSTITPENPAGTDGFEFVEFAHPEPETLRALFNAMGFTLTARHRTRALELWQQGDITYLVNDDPDSHGRQFVEAHGPCAPAMAWRVVDADHAFAHAVAQGARPFTGVKSVDWPAIEGIGGSALYFRPETPYADFTFLAESEGVAAPRGTLFHYLDHLTHNVHKGNMDLWFDFYGRLFNFRQIRFFDIEGKHSGLLSRALTSPCGRIRIPINQDRGESGQIVEYLRRYNGEGIQHIAVGSDDIYASVQTLSDNGIRFMPKPPPAYYALSKTRVQGHDEPLEALERHGILIDGEGVVDGGETRILLQIFSKTVVGPIFFEFIQRKGDDGFGEGNFRALFESIEADQIERGELKAS